MPTTGSGRVTAWRRRCRAGPRPATRCPCRARGAPRRCASPRRAPSPNRSRSPRRRSRLRSPRGRLRPRRSRPSRRRRSPGRLRTGPQPPRSRPSRLPAPAVSAPGAARERVCERCPWRRPRPDSRLSHRRRGQAPTPASAMGAQWPLRSLPVLPVRMCGTDPHDVTGRHPRARPPCPTRCGAYAAGRAGLGRAVSRKCRPERGTQCGTEWFSRRGPACPRTRAPSGRPAARRAP